MNQTWLGIDPGLATIGWAFLEEIKVEGIRLLQFGTIETSKELTTPERLLEIEQDMVELIAEFQPAHIAIEMPFLVRIPLRLTSARGRIRFFGRSIKAAGGVLQAFGVINLVCYREMGIQPIYLHQSSWKCHLGYGKADAIEG